MKKKIKRVDNYARTPAFNLRISEKDRKRLMALAKKYADGNLSAWLREAGLKYVPAEDASLST